MLSDRPYMRDPNSDQKTSVLTWLIAATASAFILELVFFSPWFKGGAEILRHVAVTIPGLQSGWLWTLFSHGFLHSTSNLLHVAVVIFGLVVFGRELLPTLGARRFLGLYAGALALGAVIWTAVNWKHGGVLMGGAAGVYGLLTVFACLHPNREISFLLFFVLPVTIKPKHLALGLAAAELFAFVFYELLGSAKPFSYAPSAHLGGMLAGLIYYRFVHDAEWRFTAAEPETELPRWVKSKVPKSEVAEPVRTVSNKRDELRAEVDRILDKINSEGFGALTPAEKRILDDAKDQLTRR